MSKLVATYPFAYGRKSLKPGDLFEADSEDDARLLCAFGKARLYRMTMEAKVETPKKWQRRYNRSDMQAED